MLKYSRMNNYFLIWLSDGLKPKKYKDYLVTSRGLAPLDSFKDAYAFLRVDQIGNKNCLFDSNYNIYYISKDEYLKNAKCSEFSYVINDIGDLKSIEKGADTIEFLIYNEELYIFNFEGEIGSFVSFLLNKYSIKTIYSKTKIVEHEEVIKFYFKSTFTNQDPLISEAIKSGLVGDYSSSSKFSFGSYKYNSSSFVPLLMWPRNKQEFASNLEQVSYYEFIKNISHKDEKLLSDLEQVSNNNGSFFLLKNDGKVVGSTVISKSSSTYLFVKFIDVFDDISSEENIVKIIDSLKYIAILQNKNLVLPIESTKSLNFYFKQGFKTIGMFKFS